jgi:SAM-dependent methyltransferase
MTSEILQSSARTGLRRGVLPDISKLQNIPVSIFREFGDRLCDIGFAKQYPAGFEGAGVHPANPLPTWHLRRRKDSLAWMQRMFVVRDPVTETEAVAAMGSALVDSFYEAGLLVAPAPDYLVSPFHVQLVEGAIILSDDPSHRGDAVFGSGPGTIALCRAMGNTEGEATLDLGCGAGAVAVRMAGMSECVTASDINPRALAFVEANAAINGVRNIRTAVSNLFDDIHGPFNLITMQLPFIPNPIGTSPTRHRFGERRGNELVLRAISELRNYLAADGKSVMVFLQPLDSRPEGAQREIEDRTRGALRNLLLLGPPSDADTFSLRYASHEPPDAEGAFENAALQMREHLDRQDIRGFCPAVCISKPAASAQGWTETVDVTDDLWANISADSVQRLFNCLDLLHRPAEELLAARMRIAQDVLTFQHFQQDEILHLAGSAGSLLRPLALKLSEWHLLKQIHAAPDAGSVLCDSDPETREAQMLTVSRALRAGVFEVSLREQ